MAGPQYVLWGFHPRYVDGKVLSLAGGTLRHCRAEEAMRVRDGGWTLGIYLDGDAPTGLRLQAEAARVRAWEQLPMFAGPDAAEQLEMPVGEVPRCPGA